MVRKALAETIRSMDLFSQPVSFRYRQQPEYQSLTGGFCSIIMIIVFLAVFTNTILETINRTNISSTMTASQNQDPTLYQVGTDQFMFAVGLMGYDFRSQQKWLDVYFEKVHVIQGAKTKQTISMVPCNKNQWIKIKKELSDIYDRIGLDSWLCPPDGTLIQLQGKYSSSVFKYYKFGVKKCNPLTDPTKTCNNSTVIDAYLNASETFQFNFYYLNTIINPNSQNFTSLYLDDLNYFLFTPTDGVTANFFLSSYEIQTEQSIYPISNMTTVKGGISTTPAQTINYKVRQKDYLKLYIRKSSLSLLYERSFRKIDDTLSYIGGLFSAIVTALILVQKFNEFSYELEIAQTLYHYSKHEPLRADNFHFPMFLAYLLYVLLQKIWIKLPWKRMHIYQNSLQEVRKQMDIRLLMKKVTYAERMAVAVFDEPKAKILHLQEPLTLEDAQIIRKDHLLYDKLAKKYFDYKQIRQEHKKQMLRLNQNSQTKDQVREDTFQSKEQIKYQFNNGTFPKMETSLSIITQPVEESEQEQELRNLIEKMKKFSDILKEQEEGGDGVSKKILDRLDPKIKQIFGNFDNYLYTQNLKKQCSVLSNYTVNLNPP